MSPTKILQIYRFVPLSFNIQYLCFVVKQSKLQKHEAFEAEVTAHKERIFAIISSGEGIITLILLMIINLHAHADLIESHQCVGREAEVRTHIEALQEQWHTLVARSAEKTQKLREANQQQRFNEGIKELDFWLEEMEAKMESEEVGKDLSSVEALMKKHQQLEADMKAHEVCNIQIDDTLIID